MTPPSSGVEPALRIEVERDDSEVLLTATGEIDLSTAAMLTAHLTDAASGGVTRVEIDCSAVQFVDSAGLRALMVAHGDLEDVGIAMVVVQPSQVVSRVLEITRLDEMLVGEKRAG